MTSPPERQELYLGYPGVSTCAANSYILCVKGSSVPSYISFILSIKLVFLYRLSLNDEMCVTEVREFVAI